MAGAAAFAAVLASAILLVVSRIRRGQAQPDLASESEALSTPTAALPLLTEPSSQSIVPATAPAANSVQARPVAARRALVAAALTGIAVVLMLISAAGFAQARFYDWPEFFGALAPAAIAFVSGVVLLGVALQRSPYRLRFMLPASAMPTGRIVWRWVASGLVLLGIGTVLGGRLLPDMPQVSPHIQFFTLLASVVLIAWGLSGAPKHLPRALSASTWLEVSFIAGLTVVALALRLIDIGSLPPGLIDEVHTLDGMMFVSGTDAGLLRQVSNFLPISLIHSYWTWLGVSLFGHSLESLRFTSAVIGSLYLPAVYLLARELFDRRTAVAAILFLVTFPLQMHYSRISFWHISDPMFAAWAVALFAVAMRRGTRWAWVWGGVALGMTQYFFEAGRLVFPPVFAAWFIWLIAARWRGIRPHLGGIALGLLMAALVALPVYFTMLVNGSPFANRFNDSGGVGSLLSNLQGYNQLDAYSQFHTIRRFFNPLLIYTTLPDSSGQWYGSGQPMVLPILVPLLLLGVAHSLWQLRSPGIVVLGTIIAISLGGILMLDNLAYVRYIVSTPFIPVLMAVGLRYTVPMLWPMLSLPESGRWRSTGAAIIPAVAVAGALLQGIFYFGPFRAEYAVTFRAGLGAPDAQDAVLRIAQLPDDGDYQIILVTRIDQDLHVARALNGFLTYPPHQLEVIRSDSFTEDYLLQLPRDRAYAFFLEPADAESYRRLATAYPLGPPAYSTQWLLPADEEYLLFLVQPPAGGASN